MDLAKLVLMLQNSKEGSEYLDYAVQRLLFGMTKPVPQYTRSLDASLQVVPKGWTIHRLSQLSDCRGGLGGWIGEIYRACDAVIAYPSSGTAATAPLAICLAALRVRFGEMLVQETVRQDEPGALPTQRNGTR